MSEDNCTALCDDVVENNTYCGVCLNDYYCPPISGASADDTCVNLQVCLTPANQITVLDAGDCSAMGVCDVCEDCDQAECGSAGTCSDSTWFPAYVIYLFYLFLHYL